MHTQSTGTGSGIPFFLLHPSPAEEPEAAIAEAAIAEAGIAEAAPSSLLIH